MSTVAATDRKPRNTSRLRGWLLPLAFLAPALLLLGALVVYPIGFTALRSTFDSSGSRFVGLDNYLAMFSSPTTFVAVRNNILWVLVAPLACTTLGLIFAVLAARIRWRTAFRLIVFMPMAVSMLAAGVIFRGLFQEDPNLGAANAIVTGVQSWLSDEANYPGARPRGQAGITAVDGVIVSAEQIPAGTRQNFPLIGLRPDSLPETATQALATAEPEPDQIVGTVWLDVVPGGGGTDGQLDPGNRGLVGIRVDAVDAAGEIAGHTTVAEDGSYVISGLRPGANYRVALPAANFTPAPEGIGWLSATLINVVLILSFIWIWAGFAMVMIGAGLSALDPSLAEAARIDGAGEWQVFTRITAPLLMPVLLVVFVTLVINVLKIFDLVYVIPPGNAKPAANVIAVEMWTASFGGGNDHGLGSALAVFLLLLVLPAMIFNIRRFRQEDR